MLRGWAILSGLTAVPANGIYAASQQQQQPFLTASTSLSSLLPESFTSILGFAAATAVEDRDPIEAALDGRIQSTGLLSSRFGMYGWPRQSFDYVIVGGGTAGLAMARRLSEDGSQSVAVIEAGGFYEIDGGNATEVPMYLFNYFLDTGYMKNPLFDWYQYTEPQPVSFAATSGLLVGTAADPWMHRALPTDPCSTCRVRHWVAAPHVVLCCITGTLTHCVCSSSRDNLKLTPLHRVGAPKVPIRSGQIMWTISPTHGRTGYHSSRNPFASPVPRPTHDRRTQQQISIPRPFSRPVVH